MMIVLFNYKQNTPEQFHQYQLASCRDEQRRERGRAGGPADLVFAQTLVGAIPYDICMVGRVGDIA